MDFGSTVNRKLISQVVCGFNKMLGCTYFCKPHLLYFKNMKDFDIHWLQLNDHNVEIGTFFAILARVTFEECEAMFKVLVFTCKIFLLCSVCSACSKKCCCLIKKTKVKLLA